MKILSVRSILAVNALGCLLALILIGFGTLTTLTYSNAIAKRAQSDITNEKIENRLHARIGHPYTEQMHYSLVGLLEKNNSFLDSSASLVISAGKVATHIGLTLFVIFTGTIFMVRKMFGHHTQALQVVAPNRSQQSTQKSTSSVRGSED